MSDGCDQCVCSERGPVACTQRACAPRDGGTTQPPALCALAIDVGPCDAAIPVWRHDPESGVCEMEACGGCEGNDNRFDSEPPCVAACPLN